MEKRSFKDLLKLFTIFFKVGAFTIGGGLAMLPIMRNEFVEKQKWVDDKQIVDIFAISQSLPGVIAINSSMYIGYTIAGVPGLIASCLGVVMPSYIIILIIAFFLQNIGDNEYLARFFLGIRSAVVPLIILAAVKLGKSAVVDKFGIVLAILSVIATIFLGLDVAVIVLTGGVLGFMYYGFKQKKQMTGEGK